MKMWAWPGRGGSEALGTLSPARLPVTDRHRG